MAASTDIRAHRQGTLGLNADKLRGFAHAEEGFYRALVARFGDIAAWPARRAAGRHIWETAQSVTALKRRLRELPTGQVAGFWHPALGEIVAELVETEDEEAFVHALYLVVKPELVKRYETYLENAVKADEPSRDVVEEVLHRTREQISWARAWLRERDFVADETESQQAKRLTALSQSLPEGRPMSPSAAEKQALQPFVARIQAYRVIGKAGVRDAAWITGGQPEAAAPEIFAANGIDPDSDHAAIVVDLLQYVRELQAAETLAHTIHESPWTMPWEFYYDTARHLWDEVRHFEMGAERLEELGVDLKTVPIPVANAMARGHVDALERYVLLVRVAEAPRFPGLREKFARLREKGDEESAAIVDFDHSDEITHVRFGEKWMPVLREQMGEERSIDQIVEDVKPRYESLLAGILEREASPHSGSLATALHSE